LSNYTPYHPLRLESPIPKALLKRGKFKFKICQRLCR